MPPASGIASVTFQNTTAVPITDQVCTFGHVFKQGDLLAAGAEVSLVGGVTLPAQIDVKATHPDGSVRHAVLSTVVPSLAANASASFSITPAAAAAGAPATPADLKGLDSIVSVTDSGAVYTASLAALLAAGYKTWLAGAIVSEWLVDGPLQTAAGAVHPDITVRFAVRAYKNKSRARVDVILENTKTTQGGATPIRHAVYDLRITVGGALGYAEDQVVHHVFTRTRKTFWWGAAAPSVHVRHDTAYAISTKAFPNYDPALISATSAAREAEYLRALNEAPGSFRCGVAAHYMPMTGGRPDIGLLPGWDVLYLLGMSPTMRKVCFDQADLMGSWRAHYRDTATGQPYHVMDYPAVSLTPQEQIVITGITAANPAVFQTATPHRFVPGMRVRPININGSMGGNLNYHELTVGECTATSFAVDAESTAWVYGGGGIVQAQNPNTYESAHTPAVGFVAYLFSGDHYHLEQLQFYAACGGEFKKTTYMNLQLRGQAWALRDHAYAAYATPDSDRLKSRFLGQLNYALDDYTANFLGDPGVNKLGALVGGYAWGTPDEVTRTWQDDFVTQSVGRILEMGFDKAAPLFQFKAKYPVDRIAYCRMLSSSYNLKLRDSVSSPVYKTIAEVFAATFPANAPKAGDNTLAQVFDSAAMGALAGPASGEDAVPANSMLGFASSSVGYPSNMQPALALAASLGYPGADAAWARFMSRAVKPDYSSDPQFAIVPRKETASAKPPAAPPTPVTKPGKIKGPSNKKLAKLGKLQVTAFDPASLAVVKSFGFVTASATGIVTVSDTAISAGKQYALKVEDEKGIVLDIMFPITATT